MNKKDETETDRGRRRRKGRGSGMSAPSRQSGGSVYGLGMIGALVYFAGKAETGQEYAMAFGKAMVWPALLVYQAFRKLGD